MRPTTPLLRPTLPGRPLWPVAGVILVLILVLAAGLHGLPGQTGSPGGECCQLTGGHRDGNSNGVDDDLEVYRHLTPAAWQAEEVRWHRDVDPKNKIDDALDFAPGTTQALAFDVVIDYKRQLTQSDLDFLSSRGTVGYVSRYITCVTLNGVSRAAIGEIAALPEVALIEKQAEYHPNLETSTAGFCVNPLGNCPNGEIEPDPSLDQWTGNGVNIVIMDTGVDNDHSAFDGVTFERGFDAFDGTFDDPDDLTGHGTHVASIALGSPFGVLVPNMPRGIANRAGLIDVRVFNANLPTTEEILIAALETVYDKRFEWGVDVINMSFTGPLGDGREALSQLIDLGVSMGIVVVAAAGNDGNVSQGIPLPAAATRAIAVGATDGRGTFQRSDETLAGFTQIGPRADDGDADVFDELKPEVVAPGDDAGFGIRAARAGTVDGVVNAAGTSMAAPHVSGLAALIIEQRGTINPQSVRNLILQTAEQRGNPNALGWNPGWGFGMGNARDTLAVSAQTEVRFPNHPPDPPWKSEDIELSDEPQVGVPVTVTAMVQNAGQVDASNVRVQFGVHVFTASVPTFYDIGTRIVDIAAGATAAVTMVWIPDNAEHQCLKAEIGYGPDLDYSNNKAQRNVKVARSPVTFELRNIFSATPQPIEFVVRMATPGSQWTVDVTPPVVTLGADDGPVTVTALPRPPFGTPDGEQEVIHIEARSDCCSLGGVSILATMRDCNGNGFDDWEDLDGGTSADADSNGIPDECDAPVSPTGNGGGQEAGLGGG